MTAAEKLRQEGRHEERREFARYMLIENKDVAEIMKWTNLSRAEIEEIKRTLKL